MEREDILKFANSIILLSKLLTKIEDRFFAGEVLQHFDGDAGLRRIFRPRRNADVVRVQRLDFRDGDGVEPDRQAAGGECDNVMKLTAREYPCSDR